MSAVPSALKAIATGQQNQQEARDPYTIFKQQLEKVKGELLPLMGNSRQNVDAFVRVVLNAVNQNPDLLGADRRSLLTSCTRAAQDGLVPDGREAVLNVRNTKVKRDGRDEWIKLVVYEPMVAGYIKNLYEHPDIALVDAAAVFANDHFKFIRGDAPRLEHEPNLTDEPGELIAAYLVVHLKNGQIKREVMPKRDIDKARAASSSNTQGASSPWVKWPDQMAIKSVIKRGSKQLPKSNKFDEMDQHDNEVMGYASTHGATHALMGGSAPALAHNPSDTLDMQMRYEQREEVLHGAGEDGRQQHQAQWRVEQREDRHVGDEPELMQFAAIAEAINKAATEIELQAARALIPRVDQEEQQPELEGLAQQREKELTKPAATTSRRRAAAPSVGE